MTSQIKAIFASVTIKTSLGPHSHKEAWFPSPPQLPELHTTQPGGTSTSPYHSSVSSLFHNPYPSNILDSLKLRKDIKFSVKFYQKPCSGQDCSLSPWVDTTRTDFDHPAL